MLKASTSIALLALLLGLSEPSHGRADEVECYDAYVRAKIVQQTPTAITECGDDCVVFYWPWIVDLKVTKVLDGSAPQGDLRVLTMQHTYYVAGRGQVRWRLRRNSLGGFNLVRPVGDTKPQRCSSSAPPARPYITPPAGQGLEDLRKDGELRYGRG